MSWPVRTRLCLECRAALSDGEACTWVRHTALSPSVPEQREQLVAAVWPSASSRGVQDLFDGFARWLRGWIALEQTGLGSPGSPPQVEVPRGPRIGADVVHGPFGAAEEPLWTASVRYPGRVASAARVAPSPIAGVDCAAYGVWLLDRHAERSPILLRDGAALGFDVELDDGRIARVPAGSVDVAGEGESRKLRRVRANLARYLAGLAPQSWAGRRGSHLPFTEVREAVIRPGDRVLIRADLHAVPDPRATGSAYRVAAAAVLRPLGRVVFDRE